MHTVQSALVVETITPKNLQISLKDMPFVKEHTMPTINAVPYTSSWPKDVTIS